MWSVEVLNDQFEQKKFRDQFKLNAIVHGLKLDFPLILYYLQSKMLVQYDLKYI